MTKRKVSWSDVVQPVFAEADRQVKFDELLRIGHQEARAALAKLQAKENDRETIEFFLLACSGIHDPNWMTAAAPPDPLTLQDVHLMRERALWLADMMDIVNGDHEDAPNPLFYIERAPAEVLCGEDGSDDVADAAQLRRRYAHFARMFQHLPAVLSVLAKFIEPWYKATEHSRGLPAANREPLMAEFYAYAHAVAKLTQPEVARLLTAGRAALSPEDQNISGDSLKTIVNRFKGSNRQAYEDFIEAVQLYLQLPIPRSSSFVALAGLGSGLPSLDISRLVRTQRRKPKKG